MTDLRSQCDEFAKMVDGCGACVGDAFDVQCNSTFGPVTVDLKSVLDPCNEDIRLNLQASALGTDPVTIDYTYVPGEALSTTTSVEDEVIDGVTAQVDITTTIRNPKLNTLAASGTADVCLTLDTGKLPADVQQSIAGITTVCSFLSDSDLCRLANGEKVCGKALSDLLQSEVLRLIIQGAIDFEIPDFDLPITLTEQSVSYSCEGGVTKILRGASAATTAQPSTFVQSVLVAATAITTLFRL